MNNDPTNPGPPTPSPAFSQPSTEPSPIKVEALESIMKEKGYDRQRSFDRVRGTTTYISVGIFALTVLLAFIAIFFSSSWANAKELLQLIIPAETALIGSAVGFYFGSKS